MNASVANATIINEETEPPPRSGVYQNYLTLESVDYGEDKPLSLYRCGPPPSSQITEVIMLHGAMYDKEAWMQKGIVDMMCNIRFSQGKPISVIALDLPVGHDSKPLKMAFDALTSRGLLSGRPAVIVTPSSSGIFIANLVKSGKHDHYKDMKRLIRAWIPVATKYVNNVSYSTLVQFKKAKIPILAIHGDKDDWYGHASTQRLRTIADAKRVEIKGSHAVFSDSPIEFVDEVLGFLDENGM